MQIKKADCKQLEFYDTTIIDKEIYASGIAGISFLKKNFGQLKNKKIVIFCVGASPYEEKTFQDICRHNLKDGLQDIPCFYCPDAWNEEVMSVKYRMLCRTKK